MAKPKIVWNADAPAPSGFTAAEIVGELATMELPEDPADRVGWLIRCARVVDWQAEPAFSVAQMRAAVDTTIRYIKWTALIFAAAGIAVGIVIGALVL